MMIILSLFSFLFFPLSLGTSYEAIPPSYLSPVAIYEITSSNDSNCGVDPETIELSDEPLVDFDEFTFFDLENLLFGVQPGPAAELADVSPSGKAIAFVDSSGEVVITTSVWTSYSSLGCDSWVVMEVPYVYPFGPGTFQFQQGYPGINPDIPHLHDNLVLQELFEN